MRLTLSKMHFFQQKIGHFEDYMYIVYSSLMGVPFDYMQTFPINISLHFDEKAANFFLKKIRDFATLMLSSHDITEKLIYFEFRLEFSVKFLVVKNKLETTRIFLLQFLLEFSYFCVLSSL